jgi:Predicted membrane protein
MDNKKANVKSGNTKIIIIGLVAILLIGFVVIKNISGGGAEDKTALQDLKIVKSEITDVAKFYPYKVGKTNMEVLAVKASDGSIRTAFNTCQVCYDSGKGYYEQSGDKLICQNCGNQFQLDQIEKIKGGCNPVPILEENKTDDGTNITIIADFLASNKDLFGNWK